jgi:hypothetical protein
MNKKTKSIIIAIVIILIIGVAYLAIGKKSLNFGKWKNQSENGASHSSKAGIYAHIDGDFTFEYPSDFTFTDLYETDDTTKAEKENIIFHGKDSKDNFQIVISGFDEEPVTLARVKREVPSLGLSDAQEISIEGARGVIFSSTDADTKMATREIWFSHAGILYQISTYPEFDSRMADILTTWKWMGNE